MQTTNRCESTMVWLERRHLAFAVANCVFNLMFAAVTVGSCGDSWKLCRVAGEASNMTGNALSILIVIFSAQLQQTEISERKLFIFHLGLQIFIHAFHHFPWPGWQGQWHWLFRCPHQLHGHFPHFWNFIYNPQKLLYLSGWSWFQFSIPGVWPDRPVNWIYRLWRHVHSWLWLTATRSSLLHYFSQLLQVFDN